MLIRKLIFVAASVVLVACGECSSGDKAVAFAQKLSAQRLAQLYQDIAALKPGDSGEVRIFKDEKTGIPPGFRDLNPESIISDGQIARIHLAGCVDNKVLLVVSGLDGTGVKEIELHPGDGTDPVVLWHSK